MPFDSNGLYQFEDISFVNTSEFTKAGQYFKKNGVYTKAPSGSREHKEFWDIEEDRRINGMTMPGKLLIDSKGRTSIQDIHITGEHYGFLNYARILRTVDPVDGNQLKHIVKDSSLLKNARKVGKKDMDFPAFFDGQYHYFKAKEVARDNGLHMVVAKARRKGFSYMEGWDSADTVNLIPFCTVLLIAQDLKYLTKGDQIFGMAKSYLEFLETDTDWSRGFLKNDKEFVKLGYKEEGSVIERGWKSKLFALSAFNNPDAAVGKDAIKIKFEEGGKFKGLKDTLAVTRSTTEAGELQTGQIVIFGTGGTEEANWEDFEDIYYNPSKFGCMVFDNIWDEGAKGSGAGFYFPQSLNLEPYIDKNGNSLIIEAKAATILNREKEKKDSTNVADYSSYIGQRSETPKESFARTGDSIFPIADIMIQLQKIEKDPDYKYLAREGQLVRDGSKVRIQTNAELQSLGISVHPYIIDVPVKKSADVHGCYVEWISPYRDKNTGVIPQKMYRIWHDPYAIDKDKTEITIKDSLGVAYVYEVVNNLNSGAGDILVACLIGRPERMDEYNENLLRLAEYWNAEVMFESNRGDVKGYFSRKKKLHLLADEPDVEHEKELKKNRTKSKGITMNDARKGKGAIFLRDWLTQPRGADGDGNVLRNLDYIYDAGLLKELLKWNLKGNFDRVSAMIVGMYDMHDCFNQEIKVVKKKDNNNFFNRRLY
jgi:penicillin-binding protein-related factor A (putative recombinase)